MNDTATIPYKLVLDSYRMFVNGGYYNDFKMHYLCEKERQMSMKYLPFIEQEDLDEVHRD